MEAMLDETFPHEEVAYIAFETFDLEVVIGLLVVVLVILETCGQVVFLDSSPYCLNLG
jgi:hypothetical protein